MSDLNGKIGCIHEACVMGEFDLKDVNDNKRRLLSMCIRNKYFKHKCLHMCTYYRTGEDMNIRRWTEYVLVRGFMLRYMNNVKEVKRVSR